MLSTRTHEMSIRLKGLDHLIEQVFFGHAGDLLVKGKPLHDLPHVLGESVDVTFQVRGELVGVVEQFGQIQSGQIVKLPAGDFFQQAAHHAFGLGLDLRMFLEHPFFGGGQQAVEAPQHRDW